MSKSASVHIPKEAYAAFEKLIDIGPVKIKQLTEVLRETGPSLDSPAIRALKICRITEAVERAETIELILRDVIFPIRRSMHRFDLTAKDMVSGLEGEISKISASAGDSDQSSEQNIASQWEKSKTAFAELLDSDTMKIEGKAEALIDARGNRVLAINLYSDLRPLFDKNGDEVKANVLTNTLVIRFDGGGRPSTQTFSLDPSDLNDLKVQVDRALRKNATLAQGCVSHDIRVLVVRSDSEESGEGQ